MKIFIAYAIFSVVMYSFFVVSGHDDRHGLTREVKQEYKECEKSLTLRSSKCYLKVVNPETEEGM